MKQKLQHIQILMLRLCLQSVAIAFSQSKNLVVIDKDFTQTTKLSSNLKSTVKKGILNPFFIKTNICHVLKIH